MPALILPPLTIQVPALGAPPSALPTADELRLPPSLKSLLRALPNRTAGLLVPRLQFDCNGLDTPAPPPLLEYEAFTRRSCAPGQLPLILALTLALALILTPTLRHRRRRQGDLAQRRHGHGCGRAARQLPHPCCEPTRRAEGPRRPRGELVGPVLGLRVGLGLGPAWLT